MTVRDDMVNGHGICHGGYVFTLADTAFAFACNTYDDVTVAAGADIDFLEPVRAGTPADRDGRRARAAAAGPASTTSPSGRRTARSSRSSAGAAAASANGCSTS